jgi:hypothetical protein
MAPGIEKIRIANLKLRSTQLENELEALRVASGNKFIWSRGISAETSVNSFGRAVAGGGMSTEAKVSSETPLFILGPNTQPTESDRNVEVFNLNHYLQHSEDPDKALDQIHRIVDNTLREMKLDDSEQPANFQFHRGASLLIVTGTPETLQVTRKVINALQGQTASAPDTFGFGGGRGGMGGFLVPAANPFSPSKERRAIVNKLESIRLDSFLSDGLPLAEILRHLMEETKKRDPERKGINFLVNPNQPLTFPPFPQIDPITGTAISQKAEAIDIGSIEIRVQPALNHVRLVDALDAVVRVATVPIRYSITDYAVVFSLKGPDEEPTPSQRY